MEIADLIVEAARTQAKLAKGKRYKLAGNTAAEGFDCSGYVLAVLRTAMPGKEIPDMTAAEIAAAGWVEVIDEAEPGALVFFPAMRADASKDNNFDHIGVVLDGSKWIGSQSSTGVAEVAMDQTYWTKRSRRYLRLKSE